MGLKDVGWDDVPVVVAETVGADSLVGRCTCINKPTSTVWLQSRMDGGCGEGVGVVIHNVENLTVNYAAIPGEFKSVTDLKELTCLCYLLLLSSSRLTFFLQSTDPPSLPPSAYLSDSHTHTHTPRLILIPKGTIVGSRRAGYTAGNYVHSKVTWSHKSVRGSLPRVPNSWTRTGQALGDG